MDLEMLSTYDLNSHAILSIFNLQPINDNSDPAEVNNMIHHTDIYLEHTWQTLKNLAVSVPITIPSDSYNCMTRLRVGSFPSCQNMTTNEAIREYKEYYKKLILLKAVLVYRKKLLE